MPTEDLAGLLIAPKASLEAQQAARRACASLLLAPDIIGQLTRGHLITPSGELLTLAQTTATSARPGPRPWATIAIATYLLEGNASTQDALAGRAVAVADEHKPIASAGHVMPP